MKTIPAKTMISRTKSPGWFDIDYTMNIYKGCSHGCIYCDSRSDCYRVENFDEVRIKENALELIRDELRKKRLKGVIATGAMSDPYNPFESNLMLTRKALEIVNEFAFGIAIATKSNLVMRDIDVLQKIKVHSPVIVKITITTADDDLCKKIEPYAPKTSERLEAIKALSDAGIYCGILMMPILPYVNDTKENLVQIVQMAKRNGANFVSPSFGVTLRDNQREYYYEKLDKLFPSLHKRYIEHFGDTYACNSEKARSLHFAFKTECERLGITYKMSEIIKEYKAPYLNQQLSMF